MPPILQIKMLGGMNVQIGDNSPLVFATRNSEILLAYLAVTGRAHSREKLATLLWDDRPQEQSLANLRAMLSRLPSDLKPYLLLERSVGLNPDMPVWTDTAAFEASLAQAEEAQPSSVAAARVEAALTLYQGDFLEGVFARSSLGLEEWMAATAERFRHLASEAGHKLATDYLHRCGYERGLYHAKRLVQLDPLLESGHRLLMQLLAHAGRLNAALAQYEKCRRLLERELGVEPAGETTALYQRVRLARLPPPHELPRPWSELVGRQAELDEINRRLADPACRLLTLAGPGGIGKTRLALAAAERWRGHFLHGIYFVALAGVETEAALLQQIAAALHLPLGSGGPPQKQLFHYLRPREMLLILDNVEQVVAEGAALVQAILAHAPAVKVLVTSRERLNLQSEWLLTLTGLPYPAGSSGPDLASFAAVALFTERVSRLRTAFSLAGAEGEAVAAICRLVEGLPLAIELSAASFAHYTAAQVAAGLQGNLDFLATTMRDVPARHRSLRAVFDHSWSLLAEGEQAAFCFLAIFRSGFTLEAAEAIWNKLPANRSLPLQPLLASLINKSLLRQADNGRYELHELVRQYAAERLAADPAYQTVALERHSVYFAAFARQRELSLKKPAQLQALAEMSQDGENLRGGWQWAAEQRRTTTLAAYVNPLFLLYELRGRFQEGLATFAQVAGELADSDLRGRLLVRQGRFAHRLGRHEEAKALLTESLHLLRQGKEPELFLAFNYLSETCRVLGDYDQAKALAQESIDFCREAGEIWGLAQAHLCLGVAYDFQGESAPASQLYRQSLALSRQIKDSRGIATALNHLGAISKITGQYQEAETLYRESLAIRRELDDRLGITTTLGNLANLLVRLEKEAEARAAYQESLIISRELGDYPGIGITQLNWGWLDYLTADYQQARRRYEESLAVFQEIGDRWGESLCYSNLGNVALALGQRRQAHTAFLAGLRKAAEIQATPVTLELLAGLAALLLQMDKGATAVTILPLVIAHPATNAEARQRAARLLAEAAGSSLPVIVLPEVEAIGKLESLVAEHLRSMA